MRSTRDWFGAALAELASEYDHVVVVSCDLAQATRTERFKQEFPERFFECGIAEANAIGLAAGLAQEGYRPFVASFGHFLTGKFLEIFQSIGLNDAGVVLVGTHAGLAIGRDGPTQMGLRDLALMRTLPNVRVLHPADGSETVQMVNFLATDRRPGYLRLGRQPQPEVHRSEYRFRFGRPQVVRDGRDVAVFAMGSTVSAALDAADRLQSAAGAWPTVVNVSSLPADRAVIAGILASHRYALVVEDHYVTGGLADDIGRIALSVPDRPWFDVLAVPDYGQAGPPEELYARYQLDAAGIAARITKFLREHAR
jgi:transketolase